MKKDGYQFRLSGEETRHFWTLRELNESILPITSSDDPRLQQPLKVNVLARDQIVGSYEVDAANLILDFARIGLEFAKIGLDVRRTLTREESHSHSPQEPDPLLKTDHEPTTWISVKEDLIPSYVQQVSFVVNEGDLTESRQKDLEERFPGVLIRKELPLVDPISMPVVDEGKPNGSDPSTVELDNVNFDDDPPSQNAPNGLDGDTNPQDLTQKPGRLRSIIPTELSKSEISVSTIEAIAGQIGLEIEPRRLADVCRMYNEWVEHGSIRSFKSESDMTVYYSSLVDLYIIASSGHMPSLQYSVLLRFQTTNFTRGEELPTIATALKIFQFLEPDSPLVKWARVLFSYLWDTRDEIDYGTFCTEHAISSSEEIAAVAKFLFSVAWTRDPYTTGLNSAVLKSWCDFHDHAPGSPEEEECRKMHAEIGYCGEDNKLSNSIQAAENLIMDHGGKITYGSNKPPSKQGKRQAEEKTGRSKKKRRTGVQNHAR